MSSFYHKKAGATSDEIASIFLSEFIVNDDLSPKTISEINAENQDQYMLKCKLYRIALILIILINEEKNNQKVLLIREALESKLFGTPNDQSRIILSQIQSSMSDLKNLLFPDDNPKELSWARHWFESLGIDIINPADLTLFAINWMDLYIATTNTLKEFKIV